jgi:hypothetical protein
LKRSDLDYYFTVAEFAVSPLKNTDREKLVQLQRSGGKQDALGGESLVEAPKALSGQKNE